MKIKKPEETLIWESGNYNFSLGLAEAMKPGSLRFRAGASGTGSNGINHPGGSFVFEMADGKEWMRFDPDGKIFVRGTEVDSDRTVYENFREWLMHAKATSGR